MGRTTPVVIQDKNGKTTTVHRLIDTNDIDRSATLPAPAITISSPTEISNETIVNILQERNDGSDYKRIPSVFHATSDRLVDSCLDFFYGEDASLFPLAVELMTTGSTVAQDMTRDSFSETVNSAASAIGERETDPDWDRTVPRSEEIKDSLMTAWTIGNLFVECGIPSTRRERNSAVVMAGFVNNFNKAASRIRKEPIRDSLEYWRGVAALVISDQIDGYELPKDSQAFIDWAGKQENLKSVLDVVKERKVLDPETIEGIMSQTDVEKSLRSGIL